APRAVPTVTARQEPIGVNHDALLLAPTLRAAALMGRAELGEVNVAHLLGERNLILLPPRLHGQPPVCRKPRRGPFCAEGDVLRGPRLWVFFSSHFLPRPRWDRSSARPFHLALPLGSATVSCARLQRCSALCCARAGVNPLMAQRSAAGMRGCQAHRRRPA